ncbi:Uncharacterized conserved protein YjgD, DUF1641 family [Paenibacillus algorifonticola]|uniref:Uncharacterized conserved protein YjgD, DUF1641 family n=1 Tax=Paenibacillus algorifonticola TaxID=684063 RepID=A0A1I2DQQ2_9BACL|nr:DUF1641 domain-containing protein [Paenibacillus algorifonticola]SFE82779.1 Uncharacterized conserved protein YjgD, DUF1641 family [Paenibacillus algorifonticola]
MSETLTEQEVQTGSVRSELDVLEQLLKPEIQSSLNQLVESLPKLAEMVTLMTKAYDVATTVANDQVLMGDMKHGIEEFVKPITDKAKGIASAAVEANDRAQAEPTTIGLFGILKMLKDPQVQQTLRFAQSFLDVLAERNKQR